MAVPESALPSAAPSALTTLIDTQTQSSELSSQASHLHQLALHIQHNLQYQHRWTQLRIYTHSTISQKLLPRPIISGLPPRRLYVHPDEQVEMLKSELERRKTRKVEDIEDDDGESDLRPEREWVLPTHLKEDWSLRRFGEIFDGIGLVPPDEDGSQLEQLYQDNGNNRWRTTKRVLLATLQDDSTVVYYIVHDGIVKPRQN